MNHFTKKYFSNSFSIKYFKLFQVKYLNKNFFLLFIKTAAPTCLPVFNFLFLLAFIFCLMV